MNYQKSVEKCNFFQTNWTVKLFDHRKHINIAQNSSVQQFGKYCIWSLTVFDINVFIECCGYSSKGWINIRSSYIYKT